jgi:hypothetical protein
MLAVQGCTLIYVSQALKNDESYRVETIASIRTVLDLSEKVLDGCPIWGPKAAVAAASQALKTVQVSTLVLLCNYLTHMLARRRLKTNKTSIASWRRCRRPPKYLLRLQQYFQPLLLSSCALGYQNMWSMCAYLLFRRSSYSAYRDLQKIRASTDPWKKGGKNAVRRLLDAERVAKELEGVMRQIDTANWRFLVRCFRVVKWEWF